jgi:hypothetical protein
LTEPSDESARLALARIKAYALPGGFTAGIGPRF